MMRVSGCIVALLLLLSALECLVSVSGTACPAYIAVTPPSGSLVARAASVAFTVQFSSDVQMNTGTSWIHVANISNADFPALFTNLQSFSVLTLIWCETPTATALNHITQPSSVLRLNDTSFQFLFSTEQFSFSEAQLVLNTKNVRYYWGQLSVDTHSVAFYRTNATQPSLSCSNTVPDITNRFQEQYCAFLQTPPNTPTTASASIASIAILPDSTADDVSIAVCLT